MTPEARTALPDAVWWERGHPQALTDPECDALAALASATDDVGLGELPVLSRLAYDLAVLNASLWQYPLEQVQPTLKVWERGRSMLLHSDYDPVYGPDQGCVTVAASVQLSASEDYTGGDVYLEDGRTLPRSRGTVGVWPGVHPARRTARHRRPPRQPRPVHDVRHQRRSTRPRLAWPLDDSA